MPNRHRSATLTVLVLTALGPAANAGEPAGHEVPSIDVFTTTNRPIAGVAAFLAEQPEANLHIHRVDGIEMLERRLSAELPADPTQAKRVALYRLQQLSPADRSELETSAQALATALELGIERVPAIVFDRASVIYGVTDLPVALQLYRSQQSGAAR